MCINKLWFFLKFSYNFLYQFIPPTLDMTCCVSTVSCILQDVMSIIPHTISTVAFLCLIVVNMKYFFTERQKPICVQFNVQRLSYRYCTHRWKINVCVIPTLRWTWLISSSPNSRYALLTHKNLSLTHYFLLLWITYRHWLTVFWVGRLTRILSSRFRAS